MAASTDYARFANDEFDADIVYGPTRAEATVSIPLGVETVTPLCSPEFAERINEIDDLVGEVLIRATSNECDGPTGSRLTARSR